MIYTILIVTIHTFRIAKTSILPIYEQYEFISNQDTFVYRTLPMVVGMMNLILIYLIVEHISKGSAFYTSLIVSLSPISLFLYGTQNDMYLAIMFFLIGIYIILKHYYLFSFIAFFIAIILNPLLIYFTFIVLIIIFENRKANTVISLASIFVITYIFAYLNTGGQHRNILSDFGAFYGLSTFGIIVAVIGFLASWKNKKSYLLTYFAIFGLILFSIINEKALFFLYMGIAYFGGLGFMAIEKRMWSTQLLKSYILTLVICGLVFSTGSYIKKVSDSGPTLSEVQSLEWLKKNNDGGKVLSFYDYGFFINFYSNTTPYTDSKYYHTSKNKLKINISEEIFKTRNYEDAAQLLSREGIKYIWINKAMKEGLIWEKKDQGILLILKNSKYFDKIYDYKDIEIYKFLG